MSIEALEAQYQAMGRNMDPATWGDEQEQQLGDLADALRAAYDAAGTDEFDRIQL